jgi:hypothetical protein
MTVLQASYRVPKLADEDGLLDHITERLKRTFYEKLDEHLAETPGGVILGPVRVTQREERDWLGADVVLINISATCEDLPEPPEYRFIGGPADGRQIRTQGQKVWMIPVMPPMGVTSYVEDPRLIPYLVAEYERTGDTGAYFYQRTREA